MSWFERLLLWGSAVLVGGSGAIYGIMRYLMTTDDPYAVVNHPLQPLVLKIHIVTAPLLVFAAGVVFLKHIWEQWRSGQARGRWSGVSTLLTLAFMVTSGYLVQTVTHGGWLRALVWTHVITGAAYLVGFVGHQIAIRGWVWRRRKSRPARGLGPVGDSAPESLPVLVDVNESPAE